MVATSIVLISIVWAAVTTLFIFRWRLLEPIIGTRRVLLLDAVLQTFLAAYVLARPIPTLEWLSYLVGVANILMAINSTRGYLLCLKLEHLKEMSKDE